MRRNAKSNSILVGGRFVTGFILIMILTLSCGGNGTGEAGVTPSGSQDRTAAADGVTGYLRTTCAEDVEVYGNALYVADGPGGLRVLDISDRGNPVLVKSIQTLYAFRVYVHEDYLYLCDGSDGFKVYSLADPFDPVMTYSEDTEWASSAAFHNGMLFLGDTFAGFRMYSLDNPGTPELIKVLEISRVRDLTFYEETLVVSDTAFGLGTYFFFSDTDPTCTYTDGNNLGNYEDIICHDGFALVARNDEASNVEAWYIGDLLRIGLASERFPARFIDGMSKYEDTLLLACGEEGIKGYDIGGLPDFYEIWMVDTPGYARRSKIVGEYLYVADMSGVCIYEVDPVGGVK